MNPNDVIFLFKSTYRNDYKRLLLSALGMPNGTIYKTYFNNRHVAADLFEAAERSPEVLIGKTLFIIFFNLREDAAIKYYPLRKFTVQQIKAGASLEFILTPNEYFNYVDTDLAEINARIRGAMPVLPPQEHSWAQIFSPACLNNIGLSNVPEVWERLIGYLDRPEIGKNDDFKDSIFYRINNLKEDRTEVIYDIVNGYNLKYGKRYIFEGYFYKPRETKESFRIQLEGSENIRLISEQIVTILPGRNQPFKFEFMCKPENSDKNIEIRVNAAGKDDGNTPRIEFPARILKIPFIKKFGWEGVAFLLGLIMTSLAQTFIHPTAAFIKTLISIAGNILSTLGLFYMARK